MTQIITTQVLHDGQLVVVYWRASLAGRLSFTLAEVRDGAIVYEDIMDAPALAVEAMAEAVRAYREENL